MLQRVNSSLDGYSNVPRNRFIHLLNSLTYSLYAFLPSLLSFFVNPPEIQWFLTEQKYVSERIYHEELICEQSTVLTYEVSR